MTPGSWGLLLGAGIGVGAWLILAGLFGRVDDGRVRLSWRERFRGPDRARLVAGIALGVLILVVTRWIAPAVALAAIVIFWSRFFGGAAQQKAAIARLDALAAWVESLRDTIATGSALPEALPATAATANPLIAPALRELIARMLGREPIDSALLHFADALDDPTADEVVATLVLNARTQGRQLKAVLTALAAATRRQLQVRSQIEADRRASRRAVKIIIGISISMALGQAVLNHTYVEPYSTPQGQAVLVVVVALFAAGIVWMKRLANFDNPRRFLATPNVRKAHAAQLAADNQDRLAAWWTR